ncbi:cyclophilin-like domain-containing protein [Auriculariales sp. MPI-PUGE-AT-0066]|nr:cyclophilin-like domain-containing protein [Auriculariales sp. MPI-PUGE-AT-0066]
MPRPRVFFDIAVGDAAPQRVIFELYNDLVPKTAENFRALATGEKGLSQISQVPLYYKARPPLIPRSDTRRTPHTRSQGSIIHRSIKGFMVQGGDFTKRNGSGGESIYGSPFPDEDLSQPIDAEALLVMANKGPNTNGSQWFITLRDCPHLNGKHVVFGRAIRGFEHIIAIGEVETDDKDRPLQPVAVVNCGELVRKQPEAARKTSASPERSVSPVEDEKAKKRSKRKHDQEDDEGERKQKKHKKKKHSTKHKQGQEEQEGRPTRGAAQETEEEYDARLEREEKERLEDARKHHLADLKRKYERDAKPSTGGIVYKGRGEMRFRDF